ncbi:hypothetical protein [Streptosporangium vulgare]|uniref:hypothetical protein n=1 Tax=Streptosporangium vulgare TaxID=46190 RepID=UPI0031D608AD
MPSGRDGIESHLSEVFGTPVRVTLRVRPARRANRKPILEARAADGPIAFVKIGDTDLTRELVAHEARTLGLLAGVAAEDRRPARRAATTGPGAACPCWR